VKLSKSQFEAVVWLGLLLCVTGLTWWHTQPPPLNHRSASSAFSAQRAMAHVFKIAAKPHPTGSSENSKVRDYLVTELKKLGIQPELQTAIVVNPQKRLAGKITNIVAKLPGKQLGKAIMLVAHYDSVPNGSGAADNAASVAALLETLRTLKNVQPMANDVIVLFTDGEEPGLLGAEAFVKQHHWANDVGVALNFEYRGNRGAFMMFETSADNGKLIENLAEAVPYILANSLMYEVYKFLPNDTDFSVFKNAGIPGLNFAAIEGHTHYHTALDRPDLLQPATLQHEGELMLGLAQLFGNIDLAELSAADRTYFDLPILGIIHYPASSLLGLNTLAGLLWLAAIGLAIKAKTLNLRRGGIGLGWFCVILIALPIAAQGLWWAIGKLHPEYTSFRQGDTYNSHWYLMAFALLTVFAFCRLLIVLSKWLSMLEFSFATLTCWLALAWFTAVKLPGANYLFLWPLLAMLGAMIILHLTQHQLTQTLVLIAGSIPALVLHITLIWQIFVGLTPQLIGVPITLLVFVTGLLPQVINGINQWHILPKLMFIGGLSCLVIGTITAGFDSNHPKQNNLFYASNSANHEAYWLSTDSQLDEWTTNFFPNNPAKQIVPQIFGADFPTKFWVAPAPLTNLPAPILSVLSDSTQNGLRHLTLLLTSQLDSPRIKLWSEGAEILSSTVSGQIYTQIPNTPWQLDTVGMAEGVVVDLIVAANNPLTLRAVAITNTLPEFTLPVRPKNTIARPGKYSDVRVAVTQYNF
jgi:Peptidase family M28